MERAETRGEGGRTSEVGRDQPTWDLMDQDKEFRLRTTIITIKAFLKGWQIVWWTDLISNLHTWFEILVLELIRFVTPDQLLSLS